MSTPRDTLIAELRAQIEEQDVEIDRLRTTLANVTASNKALTELDRKNSDYIDRLKDHIRSLEYKVNTYRVRGEGNARGKAGWGAVIDGEVHSDRSTKRPTTGDSFDWQRASREFRQKMLRS